MSIRISEKNKAIALRKQGLSYKEILKQVSVAKSTLSLWLRSVGLSKKQKQRLTKKRLDAAKRGGAKRHADRMYELARTKQEAKKEVAALSRKERWLIGALLYWAEGSKEKEYGAATNIKFSNSDPLMILLFRKWLEEFHSISSERIKYELYIHERAAWKGAKRHWASMLSILPKEIRVYFKPHNAKPKRKNTGKEYHGLIRMHVLGTSYLVRKISGWIEGICEHCGVV